ncbi:hypothetical protein MMC13_004734 [Lambiella insularis]|nr:hypothetical protein [Lambiella insularis]
MSELFRATKYWPQRASSWLRTPTNCLLTVPFNSTIGAQFVQYLKDTVVFQSTLGYLRNPPTSYQQPPVDILAALNAIGANITAGTYENEYDFEASVGAVLLAAHDAHLNVNAGALSVFSFGSAYAISSVSIDGIQVPQVYLTEDLYYAQLLGADFTPSPITTINGQEVNQFLVNFASANSFGLLEPNADWNALMYNPAADIQSTPSAFTGASSFFPGKDLNLGFENGTQLPTQWHSLASVLFGAPPINNGQDFFNYFVLNTDPNGEDSPAAATSTVAASSPTITPSPTTPESSSNSPSSSSQGIPTMTAWNVAAYPSNPDVQFFPPITPFGGSRLRAFDFSDALGTTFTQYYAQNTLNQSYADAFLGIPWAVLDYLDANNNQNFTSWPEFFGPHADRGDSFSTVQRDNLSSTLFDEVASGGYYEDGTRQLEL